MDSQYKLLSELLSDQAAFITSPKTSFANYWGGGVLPPSVYGSVELYSRHILHQLLLDSRFVAYPIVFSRIVLLAKLIPCMNTQYLHLLTSSLALRALAYCAKDPPFETHFEPRVGHSLTAHSTANGDLRAFPHHC